MINGDLFFELEARADGSADVLEYNLNRLSTYIDLASTLRDHLVQRFELGPGGMPEDWNACVRSWTN